MKRLFFFSKHYHEGKDIDTAMAIDCILTGRRKPDREPNKFKSRKKYRKGELIAVWKDSGEKCFVITAYWNVRR